MANKSKVQSVEPDIADLVNGWLKSYGLDYKLEQPVLWESPLKINSHMVRNYAVHKALSLKCSYL